MCQTLFRSWDSNGEQMVPHGVYSLVGEAEGSNNHSNKCKTVLVVMKRHTWCFEKL